MVLCPSVTIMGNTTQRPAGPRSADDRKELKSRLPLREGLRLLEKSEVASTLASLCGPRAKKVSDAYDDAKARLQEQGAELEIVQVRHGGMRLRALCELPTKDRTLDEDLERMASGMGFRLALRSMPVTGGPLKDRLERMERPEGYGEKAVYHVPRTIRTYVLREGPSTGNDVERVDRRAEDFLKLIDDLKRLMDERAPMNVVALSSARPRGQVLKPTALDEGKAVALRA